VIPRRDGRILVGSTLEYVGFDKRTTEQGLNELQQAAVELIPDLAALPIEHHWAGLRPGSPDGVPVIGPHPDISNLYICAGHFRNGVVLGPASARVLSDQLLGLRPALDPAPYLPEKKAKN
jgi:glycine oxidase